MFNTALQEFLLYVDFKGSDEQEGQTTVGHSFVVLKDLVPEQPLEQAKIIKEKKFFKTFCPLPSVGSEFLDAIKRSII